MEMIGVDNASIPGPSRASDPPRADIEIAAVIDVLRGHAASNSIGDAYARRHARKMESGKVVIDDASAKYAETANSTIDGDGVKD